VGAAAFFGAVLYTILATKEYPPQDLAEFRRKREDTKGVGALIAEILEAVKDMPLVMKRLAPVQICTWLGLFCMWLYFPVAVAHNVFGAPDEKSPLYQQGVEWAGLCFGMYSVVTFVFAFFLPGLAERVGRRLTHSMCLLAGAAGLLSVGVIHEPKLLLLSMTGIGIAWASILSMPYALLSASLPAERTGVYMGIFNFFIVLPEIVASLVFGQVMTHLLGGDRLAAVLLGGFFLAVAALLVRRVPGEVEAGR
jgi:maltose/moltooligosaccharide transporter